MKLNLHSWDDPASPERLNLVFTERNHDYGAYTLRRDYERNTFLAVLFTFSSALILAIVPGIYNYFNPATARPISKIPDIIYKIEEVVLPDKTDPVQPDSKLQNNQDPSHKDFIPVVIDSTVAIIDTADKEPPVFTGDPKGKDNDSLLADIYTGKDNGGEKTPETKFTHVEEMPVFKGGEAEMMKYIASHLQYPEDAKSEKVQGTVYLSFVVNKKGMIKEAAIIKGIGGGCEEEALRVLQSMPDWIPGKQNGKEVNVQFVLPVKFTLR